MGACNTREFYLQFHMLYILYSSSVCIYVYILHKLNSYKGFQVGTPISFNICTYTEEKNCKYTKL